ncbi:MAG: SPOR domain-containing protein [Spirochaetaceae bacterium]|nr:SPOR domain-containing protein [Spirochaetaceae bacterium]
MATPPRGRSARSGGALRTTGRLVMLVGWGFAAGLVIGVLSEEPELLAGHLRGDGESVVLAPPTEPVGEADPGGAGSAVEVDLAARAAVEAPAVARAGEEPAGAQARVERVVTTAAAESRPAPPPAGAEPRVDARALAMRASDELERERPAAQPVAAAAPARAAVSAPPPRGASGWAIQVGAFSDEAVARKLVDGLRGKGFPTELVPAEGRKERWRVRVQPVAGEREARAMAERLKRDERLPTWVLPLEARSGS